MQAMSAEPIRYFHRAKQVVETEQIYGGDWLRWTYGTGLGRFALNALVKRAIVSRYYGWKMSQKASAHRVLPFIVDYALDVDEFAKKPYAFKSVQRVLLPRPQARSARPVASRAMRASRCCRRTAGTWRSPNVDAAEDFYVKGAEASTWAFCRQRGGWADSSPAARCSSLGYARWIITGFISRWPARPASRG
jgi:phosphatidylserine decarboxylase